MLFQNRTRRRTLQALAGAAITPLKVSYDPTRELYQAYNAAFAKY